MSSITMGRIQPRATGDWRHLDYKRIAAIACVIIMHVLVLGAIMQPVKPIDRTVTYLDDTSFVLEAEPPPPPPPPPVVDIIKPRRTETVVTPRPAPAPMPIDAPVLVATTAIPSEEQGEIGPQTNIVAPTPELSGPPVEQTLGLVKAPPPPYVNPRAEGTLKFRVLVNAEGKAVDIVLTQSTGDRRLDRSTLNHIKRKWIFQAATVDGRAIEVWGRGSVTFKMEG